MEKLGVDLTSLIWQAVNFLILLFLLQRFLYKPIIGMLDARAQRVRDSMAEADRAREQAAKTTEECRTLLNQARRDASEVVNNATRQAQSMLEQARKDAAEERQARLNRALEEIEQARKQAAADLRRQVADLVVLAAGRVIGRSLDTQQHYAVIDEMLHEAREL